MLAPWKKSYDQPRQHIEKQRHYFANKVCLVKTMFFPVVVYGWELEDKESRMPKNWCFWTVVLEKTLESPLDCKEIQPVYLKVLNIHRKDWCWSWNSSTLATWYEELRDPGAGKDWRQEEKGMAEKEMVGWHHRLNTHKSEQAVAVGSGQGSLACCGPCSYKESKTTEWLNWTELNWPSLVSPTLNRSLEEELLAWAKA